MTKELNVQKETFFNQLINDFYQWHEVEAKGLDVVSNGIDFLLYMSLKDFEDFLDVNRSVSLTNRETRWLKYIKELYDDSCSK